MCRDQEPKMSGWLLRQDGQHPIHVLIGEDVEGGCFLSCSSTLGEGWVLRGNRPVDRSKVVSQPWAPVIPRLLCSVFLTFSENFSISVIYVILMNCGQ